MCCFPFSAVRVRVAVGSMLCVSVLLLVQCCACLCGCWFNAVRVCVAVGSMLCVSVLLLVQCCACLYGCWFNAVRVCVAVGSMLCWSVFSLPGALFVICSTGRGFEHLCNKCNPRPGPHTDLQHTWYFAIEREPGFPISFSSLYISRIL